jgi:hypothetical protein
MENLAEPTFRKCYTQMLKNYEEYLKLLLNQVLKRFDQLLKTILDDSPCILQHDYLVNTKIY